MSDFLDEVKADVEAAAEIPTEEKLSSLAKLAENLVVVEDAIAEVEDKLAELKRQKRKLAEIEIPDIMNEIGIQEFKLKGGLKVNVKSVFTGKITEENAEEAFKWLDEHGHGGIVKGMIQIPYRLDDDKETIRKIEAFASEMGYEANEKLAVHHMTLSAFIKDQITQGKEFPRDLFNVWAGFNTKIGR